MSVLVQWVMDVDIDIGDHEYHSKIIVVQYGIIIDYITMQKVRYTGSKVIPVVQSSVCILPVHRTSQA